MSVPEFAFPSSPAFFQIIPQCLRNLTRGCARLVQFGRFERDGGHDGVPATSILFAELSQIVAPSRREGFTRRRLTMKEFARKRQRVQ